MVIFFLTIYGLYYKSVWYYGPVALLQKELDLQRINQELDEVDVFISAITASKAAL